MPRKIALFTLAFLVTTLYLWTQALFLCLPFFSCVVSHALPAFPGAEGFGTESPGGRGGKVIRVTNINSTGQGSLYQALFTPGPRIIVFTVSGVINLSPGVQIYLEAANLSYFTVAGQTSPGGITITAGSGNTAFFQYTNNQTHDMVWRFIRFRANPGCDHSFEGYGTHHLVLDHCDFSGGFDECRERRKKDNISLQLSMEG